MGFPSVVLETSASRLGLHPTPHQPNSDSILSEED